MNSCSLYFIGCNFRCLGCYWKKIYPRVDLTELKLLTLDEVLDTLKPVSPQTVILISGEAVENREYSVLPQTLYETFDCEVRLMTNGYILPETIGLEHVSLSIKALNDDLHRRYTGKSNETSLRNLKFLHENGVAVSVSSVLIPGLIDQEEIGKIAHFIGGIDKNIPYRIIGYMPVDGFKYRKPRYEELQEVAESVSDVLNNVVFSDPKAQDYTGIIDLFSNNLQR